jgi:phenylacetate-CoA ligase
VPIADLYSTEEAGLIALQCPLHTHYHVQSEAVLVEILDEQGAPCGAGQIGRVVVTPLHNLPMPLMRYVIGDYAEVGPPCDCGRTLPVLTRILGRDRNRLVMPNSERTYAAVSPRIGEVAAIIQHKMLHTRIDKLELRVVMRRQLTDDKISFLRDVIQRNLDHPFPLEIVYVDSIPRTESRKFEDFRCELP